MRIRPARFGRGVRRRLTLHHARPGTTSQNGVDEDHKQCSALYNLVSVEPTAVASGERVSDEVLSASLGMVLYVLNPAAWAAEATKRNHALALAPRQASRTIAGVC